MRPTQFYQRRYLPNHGRHASTIYATNRSEFFNGQLFNITTSGATPAMMNLNVIPTEEEIARRQIAFARSSFAPNATAQQFLRYFPNGKIDLEQIVNVFNGTNLNLQEILNRIDETLKFGNFSFTRTSQRTGKTSTRKRTGVALLTTPVDTQHFSANVPAYKELQLAFAGLMDLLNSVLNSSNGAIIQNQDIQTQMATMTTALREFNAALAEYEVSGRIPTQMTSFDYATLDWAVNRLKGSFLEDNVLDFINAEVPNIFFENVRAINTSRIEVQNANRPKLHHQIGGGADGIFIDMDNPDLFTAPLPFNYTVDSQQGAARTIGDFLNEVDRLNGANRTVVIDDEDAYFRMIQQYGNGINIKSGRNQSLVNPGRSKISISQFPNTTYAKILRLLLDWYSFGHIYSSLIAYNLFFDYNLIHLMIPLLGRGNSLVAVRGGIMPLATYLEEQWNDHHAYIKAVEAIRLRAGATYTYKIAAVSGRRITGTSDN